MKSLKIIEHVKNAPEFMGGDERYKNSINSSIKYTEDIMTIKQDLEILELIIIKQVDLYLLTNIIKCCENNEEILKGYNCNLRFEKHHLTLEELLKLKQWLEVN